MRARLSLYVLPVLAIVACKEALPLVDGGDPEGDAQTPEQDASSVADSALVDSGSPDSSADVSAPQDGGGDALDASADAYVAPSEDGGIVTGVVPVEGRAGAQWAMPADGGGIRPCGPDASVEGNCCRWSTVQVSGSRMVPVSFDLTSGVLTIDGVALAPVATAEVDAGYFRGSRLSTKETVPVAVSYVSGPPAQVAEVTAAFNLPNYRDQNVAAWTFTTVTWDRVAKKLTFTSSHDPRYNNNGCITTGMVNVSGPR